MWTEPLGFDPKLADVNRFDAVNPTEILSSHQGNSALRDAKLLHAEVEGRSRDSETDSGTMGAGHDPPGGLERLTDVVSFCFF